VLTTCLFFMLAGMTARTRADGRPAPAGEDAAPAAPYLAYGVRAPTVHGGDADVGVAIPGAMAFLGMVFFCCVLLVTGLPPLPGFLAKFTLLSTALDAATGGVPASTWVLCGAVLLSGLAGIVALSRVGMRLFWSLAPRTTPRLRLVEATPVGLVMVLMIGLALSADPVTRYLESAARSLHQPDTYVRTVLSQRGGAPEGKAPP
jgi:multicomponent K+:H+ antiporter subunit D